MYLNEYIVYKLFMIIMFIGVETVICAPTDRRSALPENDYVLRSCMSSVEFNRRNVHVSRTKLPIAPQHPRGRTTTLPVIQSSLSRYPLKSIETKVHGKFRGKLDQRSVVRVRPSRVIADTPLTTLNVERKARNDVPQLFMPKYILPEIRSSKYGGENNNKEASIIFIELKS